MAGEAPICNGDLFEDFGYLANTPASQAVLEGTVGQRKNPPTKGMADRRSALKHPHGRQNGGMPSKQRTTETVDAGAAAHFI